MRLLATIALLSVSVSAFAQIKVDSSFAVNGCTTNGPRPDVGGAGIAIQPDGKIVVPASGSTQYSRLYRFKPNGSLDSSFGVNGYAQSPDLMFGFSYIKSAVWTDKIANIAAVVQPDGRIVTCGDFEFCGQISCGSQMPLLTRWKSNGTIDSTFGTNGSLVPMHNLNGASMYFAQLTGMKPAGGGKLYVSGYEWYDNFIARLNPDGSFDNSFGVGGFCHFPFCDTARDTMCARSTAFTIDSSGNIYAVGPYSADMRAANGGSYGYYVLRIRLNGTFDPAFGYKGLSAFTYDPIVTTRAICIRGDHKIVVAGSIVDSAMAMDEDCFTTLLEASGTPAAAMPATGYLRMRKDTWNKGVALIPDSTNGALLAMTSDHYNYTAYYDTMTTYVMRLVANGKVDTTWPNKGVLTLAVKGAQMLQASSLTAAANGKIVLAGALHYPTGGDPVMLMQLKRAIYTATPSGVPSIQINSGLSVSVYPNPAVSAATLAISTINQQSVLVNISDMQGRALWSSSLIFYTPGTHELTIPMQEFSAGPYLYRLSDAYGRLLAGGIISKQ